MMSENKKLTLFAASSCEIAENPLWNAAQQMLYWLGSGGKVFRKTYDSQPNVFESFYFGIGKIGGMVFTRNNALVLFAEHGRVWRWDQKSKPTLIAELPRASNTTFFNDVIVDSQGRVFCGVLANDFFNLANRGTDGSLWRLDADGIFHCLESNIGSTPNGMGFSPDQKFFYFSVSDKGVVHRYDYDSITEDITNRKPHIKQGGPDGMTVDSEGCIWIAHWSDSLTRYSPDGQKLLKYPIPPHVRAFSSVTLGGPNYQTIFITTANHPEDADAANFLDGGVFKLEQSIRGVPEFTAAL